MSLTNYERIDPEEIIMELKKLIDYFSKRYTNLHSSHEKDIPITSTD
ncbi:MAG: hypothetical protein ACP5NS_01350 [Candidatus Pacearchaeota archaeon]